MENLTILGVLPVVAARFFASQNRRLARLEFDNFCLRDPWNVSEQVRQIYYALFHRELTAYYSKLTRDANQVNELDYLKNGGYAGENVYDVEYNFKENKVDRVKNHLKRFVEHKPQVYVKEERFVDFDFLKNREGDAWSNSDGYSTSKKTCVRNKNTGKKMPDKKNRYTLQQAQIHLIGYIHRNVICHSIGPHKIWWDLSKKTINQEVITQHLRIQALIKAKKNTKDNEDIKYVPDFWQIILYYFAERCTVKDKKYWRGYIHKK